MNKSSQHYIRLIVIALVVVLIGSLIASFVNTSGGTVRVKDVRFVGKNGDILRALLYIPKGVTNQNPGPAILVIGGGDSTSDQFSAFSVEFSRRGYVVFNFDKRGEGFSEGLGNSIGNTAYGGPEALAYLRTLDFVDPERISLVGHSQGGSAITSAALAYPDAYVSMLPIGSTTPVMAGEDGDPSQLRNVGYICGIDDRCRYDPANAEKLLGLKLSSMNHGEYYGSLSDGTGRVLYYVPVQHNAQWIWPESIGYTIEWMQATLPAPNELPANNQVYLWRFFGTTIALIASLFLVFPIGGLLLKTTCFSNLNEPMPEFKGSQGKAWWLSAFLSAAIPVVSLFKFHAWGVKLLPPSKLWPMGRISGLMFWAVLNGAITIIFLLVNHYVLKADNGATGINYGLTWPNTGLDWKKVGKSIVLGILIFLAILFIVSLIYWWLRIDFRIWTVFLRPVTPLTLRILLQYVLPFFAFTLVFGASLHGSLRPKSGKLGFWRELLINIAVIAPWFLLLQAAYYGPLMAGYVGVPFSGGQMRHFITSLPIVMTVFGSVSTYFFHKTGHVYVGATINALLVTWYLVSGNMITVAF